MGEVGLDWALREDLLDRERPNWSKQLFTCLNGRGMVWVVEVRVTVSFRQSEA